MNFLASFGSLMSGRSFSSTSSRYGFNGKMKDNEVEGDGDVYDYGARMLDVRLGRWLSVDPLTKKFPNISPYAFAGNSPIYMVDPDGKIIMVATESGRQQVLNIMTKAFGTEGKNFSFNEKSQLIFTGDATKFNKDEKEVFDGLNSVIISPVVTNVTFEKNAYTDAHGGEATATISDNPGAKTNEITIDPIEEFEKVESITYETQYVMPNGTLTTNPDIASDKDGNVKVASEKKKTINTTSDSKAARLFHGLGHVIHQKPSEQPKVDIPEHVDPLNGV